MKITRTVQKLYDALWCGLHKLYIGEGLYIDINELTISDVTPDNEEDPDGALYTIVGQYGRNSTDEGLNFNYNFNLQYSDKDSDEFIAGMFYQIMVYNEAE